eukprot:CAMPEP_0116153052 /NCGR_PEP_ID=MMETSP0329-20121206/21015_1 /TAXON_ID=697910 /ORGANISM="Pseudo-nitzschia arenysensis, Strain B593" /LENGTH=116 /DNA_ID=CAMNT_0003649887 /DNA_START=138 /DNA_END=488 /DNA_ORIENTATION=+
MISTKTFLFALLLAMVSTLSAAAEVDTYRDLMMMDDDNSTTMDMMDEGCHCMGGGMIHCEDPADEIACHCMGSEVHCGMMGTEMEDSMDTMEMESGAYSMRFAGAAIAGAIVAAAL